MQGGLCAPASLRARGSDLVRNALSIGSEVAVEVDERTHAPHLQRERLALSARPRYRKRSLAMNRETRRVPQRRAVTRDQRLTARLLAAVSGLVGKLQVIRDEI